MSKCASCGVYRCTENGPEFPAFCPSKNDEEVIRQAVVCYGKEDKDTALVAAEVEATGYGNWPRLLQK